MSTLDIFNIIAGISSIIGLVFSIWINYRTGKIQENIEYAYSVESFNTNRDLIMDELRSSGLNAIREDFPDKTLLSDFQYDIIVYRKKYANLLTPEENDNINELINLTKTSDFDKDNYTYLLNQITSKPKIRGKSNV